MVGAPWEMSVFMEWLRPDWGSLQAWVMHSVWLGLICLPPDPAPLAQEGLYNHCVETESQVLLAFAPLVASSW